MEGSVDLHEEAGKENEQTLANLSAAEEATSKDEVEIEKFLHEQKSKNIFFFGLIINILLTELGWSVWESLDLGRWYRPHCVRSVLASSVKILPCRPPARLIRTENWVLSHVFPIFPIRRFYSRKKHPCL